MPKFLLIGLCEPKDESSQAAFDEWFVDQHIEDTAHCPNFIRGRVYKLRGPHLDLDTATQYISLYEVEAPSYEEAERTLNAWQADPDAWPGRALHQQTTERLGEIPMRIGGSGWYELLRSFDGPAAEQK
jgi:hypothetical protein